MRNESELFGFERIETYPLLISTIMFSFMWNPIVEREELFQRGVGEDSDIVSKVVILQIILLGNVHISW